MSKHWYGVQWPEQGATLLGEQVFFTVAGAKGDLENAVTLATLGVPKDSVWSAVYRHPGLRSPVHKTEFEIAATLIGWLIFCELDGERVWFSVGEDRQENKVTWTSDDAERATIHRQPGQNDQDWTAAIHAKRRSHLKSIAPDGRFPKTHFNVGR
jgi:hypothetical protein